MDIQSFLQSGLLESYALSHCTPEERKQVEEMLQQYPEARAELEAIELALEQYAQTQAVTPPVGVKDRIMQEIDGASPQMTAQVNSSMLRLFQVAAVLFLAAATYFWMQQRTTAQQLEAAQQQSLALQQQIQDCSSSLATQRAIVELLRDPKIRPVKMSNQLNPAAIPSYVFNNDSTGPCKISVDVASLPVQPNGKYLQFWAIVDKTPVSMGMIRIDSVNGIQTFDCNPNADGFAVSIENNPEGNATPSTVLMYGLQG
ncbi:MAG: anti-sigma factor [Saprospiraceae bacterium]|nr:anti-sigma factor [Saprospiraceae bacterium]